jgi:glucoamylase
MELRIRVLILALLAVCFTIPTLGYSIPSLSGFSPAIRTSHIQRPLRETLDDWIDKEDHIALDKLLANVKPGGRNVEEKARGVVDGTIIASPSKNNPDYWYQCMNHPGRSCKVGLD